MSNPLNHETPATSAGADREIVPVARDVERAWGSVNAAFDKARKGDNNVESDLLDAIHALEVARVRLRRIGG